MKIVMLLAVLAAGVWLGMNFANERPLLSNPFAEPSAADRLRDATGEAAEAAQDLYRDTRDDLKERLGQ